MARSSFVQQSVVLSPAVWFILLIFLAVYCCHGSPQFLVDQRVVTYQIGFKLWENRRSKTYKGTDCDSVSGRCDTRFVADVELIDEDRHNAERGQQFMYTWPGPHAERDWVLVGKKQYETTTLHDFATLDITNLQRGQFAAAILRVHVLDVDVMKNDNINWFICRLPGLQDLSITSDEPRAEFGRLIECRSTLNVIPDFRDSFDRHAVDDMRLRVAVRAWHTAPASSLPESSIGIVEREPYTFARRQFDEEQHKRDESMQQPGASLAERETQLRPLGNYTTVDSAHSLAIRHWLLHGSALLSSLCITWFLSTF